jgi:hypothetical protein
MAAGRALFGVVEDFLSAVRTRDGCQFARVTLLIVVEVFLRSATALPPIVVFIKHDWGRHEGWMKSNRDERV